MLPTESIITFSIASALLSIAPGPDNIFVLTHAALHGKKSGILITLGLCTGLIAHTLAVALGVAAMLHASPVAFTILKSAGALYLLYLAWLAFRASAKKLDGSSSGTNSGSALYRRGIIMNVTNPKVSIFFLAYLPQFASPEHGTLALQVLLLGLVFMGIALILFSGMALLAGTLGGWLNRSPKVQLGLHRVAGIVFVLLAATLIF